MLVRIVTRHDPKGNPRRGWLRVDDRGQLLDWIEESYEGNAPITGLEDGKTMVINVSASEYRRLRMLGESAGRREASK